MVSVHPTFSRDPSLSVHPDPLKQNIHTYIYAYMPKHKKFSVRRIMLLKAFFFLHQYLLLSVLVKSAMGDAGIARILPPEYLRK